MPGYFTEIFRLFFPERCAACGNVLPDGSYLLCPHCRWDMPLTGYCGVHDNPVYRKFGGLLPVAEASSWLFFVSHSRYRDMIHSFKYRGQWEISRKLGSLMGDALHESGLYDSVDAVVPVPLHSMRRLRRGYNQAEYLAEGIACGLGKPLCTGNVVRSRHNRSQASTRVRDERWDNVKNIFSVRHPEALDGRHILLVDDVLTTGRYADLVRGNHPTRMPFLPYQRQYVGRIGSRAVRPSQRGRTLNRHSAASYNPGRDLPTRYLA